MNVTKFLCERLLRLVKVVFTRFLSTFSWEKFLKNVPYFFVFHKYMILHNFNMF